MEAGTLPRSSAADPAVVRVTRPADRAAWRALLEASPDATVFQTPEWTDACTSVCWTLNPGVTTGSTQINFTAVDDAGRTLSFSTPRVTLR